MKQVIVGTYEMGYIQVELVLREDIGGEFYPCKPDIFEQTYEPVEDD